MEVILPPSIDKVLLIKDDKLCGEIYMSCDPGGRTEYICGSFIGLDFVFSSNRSEARHYKELPSKAIWSTIDNKYHQYANSYSDKDVPKYSNNTDIKPNLVRPLVTITALRDVFNVFPESEYCVIQNDQDYTAYSLEDIVTYPNSVLTSAIVKPILEQRLQKYNNEEAYKIIRRQVLLVKLVGKSSIKNTKFQELLLVDCNVLNKEVLAIAAGMKIALYRCSLTERVPLLELLHYKLIGNITLPVVTCPIIDAIKVNADKLAELSESLRMTYTITDEIDKLRTVLRTNSEDKDSVNEQLVQSSEIISKLRCDNRTANSRITELEVELSANIVRTKSLEVQLELSANTEKSLNKTITQLKDESYKLNKRINILEINAAKDEALIQNLRAEKAFWNTSTTRNFEDEQKRSREIQELKDRLNSIL
jgi:hypothetical protein